MFEDTFVRAAEFGTRTRFFDRFRRTEVSPARQSNTLTNTSKMNRLKSTKLSVSTVLLFLADSIAGADALASCAGSCS